MESNTVNKKVDSALALVIKGLNRPQKQLRFPQHLPQNPSGDTVVGLLQVHETHEDLKVKLP